MKKTLLAALAVPFVIAIPVVAHASPPPSIFTPQQECDSTRKLIDSARKINPNARTADQVVDTFIKMKKLEGLEPDPTDPNENELRQFTKDNMKRCNIH